MRQGWSTEAEKRYQAMLTEQGRQRAHALCLLAIVLFPLFGYLDYFAHPEHVSELWTIRAVTVAAYLVLYLCIRRGVFLARPYPLVLVLAAIAAVSITAMCLLLGGYESPYYAGVNLVVLAVVVVVPVGAIRMALACLLVLGIYLAGIFAHAGFDIEQPKALINNLYFLVATAVIGVVAAQLTDRLRRESFQRYLDLERAQADLKYSRDMLQLELRSEQGNVEVLVREITARKVELERALGVARLARDEAQAALQLREEFMSLASHELRTPLTSLRLQTQLAQRQMDNDDDLSVAAMAKLISSYDQQLNRLVRIVEDMFDVSRIKSGRLELELARVDLEQLIRGVVERTVGGTGDQPEVRVIAQGPIWGEWDALRIEQVIVNLLTNAIKYGNGKPVEIRLSERADGIAEVRVSDQGIGIEPGNQHRIFERFERAVARNEFAGLGLGLYISRQLVRAHGGDISVESRLGQGSTFIVRLPAERAAGAAAPSARGPGKTA